VNPTNEEIAEQLESALHSPIRHLERLSGGASRITYSFELDAGAEPGRRLILQQYRSDGVGRGGQNLVEARLLDAARSRGVPVPTVVAVGEATAQNPGWLVLERLDGETIPRKVLRDPEWATARAALTEQCARALAAIHTIEPADIEGLAGHDPFENPLALLDMTNDVRPALELGVRWLRTHRRPSSQLVTVHGDFRMGNLMVGPDGLVGVLDWELAHRGDPAEDIGWLSARAWRFGGTGEVGGFGDLSTLLAAYERAGGAAIDVDDVRWWQVYATVKWAVICAMQASTHLGGSTRSIELAAIGRRVCENEWDLFCLLGVEPPDNEPAPALGARDALEPFGRPSDVELLEAAAEYLDAKVMATSAGASRFEARIARNVIQIVERQIRLGPAIAEAHARRLGELGFNSDVALAAAIRSGSLDERLEQIAPLLCASARDELLVANPAYLER